MVVELHRNSGSSFVQVSTKAVILEAKCIFSDAIKSYNTTISTRTVRIASRVSDFARFTGGRWFASFVAMSVIGCAHDLSMVPILIICSK